MGDRHIASEDCWCGPATQPVKRDDGSVGWIYVHKVEENKLGPFPVDDLTLAAIEHSLDHRLTFVDGELVGVGADMSLTDLLDFLSGYDPTKVEVPADPGDGPQITEYIGGPLYTHESVIRALITEVRRLREASESVGGEP